MNLSKALIVASVVIGLTEGAANASGHALGSLDSPAMVVAGAAVAVLPSEAGALIDRGAHFDLGWSWQVPISPSFRNRVVGGVDWVPGVDAHRWRGRAGYRFGTRDFILGLGVAFDHAGTDWSPEVGLRLRRSRKVVDEQYDPALHVLVRADVAPEVNRLRVVTILLGWTLF